MVILIVDIIIVIVNCDYLYGTVAAELVVTWL
jgi:hypothetical protein